MARRLAAVHDPSGVSFNVQPVTILEDGRVTTLEALERKKERQAQREAEARAEADNAPAQSNSDIEDERAAAQAALVADNPLLNPERMKALIDAKMPQKQRTGMSKTAQKKRESYAPRPPPPKPTIPEGIDVPSDEEENWLELWDLPDGDLERRVMRAKKRAARARKELRIRQKQGKAERRAARDEKRRVYREIKQSWKIIREEERRRRKFLMSMEDEERKKIALEISKQNREEAMKVAAGLGFTLENVEGVDEITPKVSGMKGVEVDFTKIELLGDAESRLRLLHEEEKKEEKPKRNRVDLGAIADESNLKPVYGYDSRNGDARDLGHDFVDFGKTPGQDHQALSYNHKLRRKLRRAMEAAQIKRELLVREKAIQLCEQNGIEVPPVLRTPGKPENTRGQRTMPDGTLETAKQERIRSRVELAEFNKMAKILRRQAKERATEAGIRVYLELMGRIPKREGLDEEIAAREAAKASASRPGALAEPMSMSMSMAGMIDAWPVPEDTYAEDVDITGHMRDYGTPEASFDRQISQDSASKQVRVELHGPQINGISKREGLWRSQPQKGGTGDLDDEMSDVP